jgi:hypothetical protein
MAQQAVADNPANIKGKKEEALPLPSFLMKIYYIFPIVLYLPDMLFNFFVYSDGSGLNLNNLGDPVNLFYAVLWGFLSIGIVGMAWLCSVLAPWHWLRGNKFQSIMCWIGVVVATCITIWNSLAFRSQNFHQFATDKWFAATFHITGISPTMVLVAVAPPFWGLFWAIVQPAVGKKSANEAAEDHAMKMERLKQEAEYKRLRAEANAQIRAAQLKGLAATVRSAREQIGTKTDGENGEMPESNTGEYPAASERVVSLPSASIRRLSERRPVWNGEETTESGEHEIVRTAVGSMSYSAAAQSRDDVFEAPSGEYAVRPMQSMLPMDNRNTHSGEHETVVSTSRPGMPRASTLLRNYADGEHVMRAVDADVDRMRAQGMKITIKSFAEFRGIELSLSKQLLAKWREWKQQQAQPVADGAMAD